jgi:hypothetical protein
MLNMSQDLDRYNSLPSRLHGVESISSLPFSIVYFIHNSLPLNHRKANQLSARAPSSPRSSQEYACHSQRSRGDTQRDAHETMREGEGKGQRLSYNWNDVTDSEHCTAPFQTVLQIPPSSLWCIYAGPEAGPEVGPGSRSGHVQ